MSPADTIAAIATAPGRGGVGIVRVSGERAPAISQGVIGRIPPPRQATLATFVDASGAAIDSGLALHFPAPGSYTGEHVVELQGHGSPAALRALLARVVELGARVAEPGEFTRRAFLNGKLDLVEAEAVADLIEAATATAARAAARSLTGEFSARIHAVVDEVTELRMILEASLDFPEEDVGFVRAADFERRLGVVLQTLDGLLRAARTGARLRDGLVVVLAGPPNVGKSSLLNALVRHEAAIVTDIPGTTRDTVERPLDLAGVPVTLVDTAGLRATDDRVEQLGIARTREALARADLALVLVDARDREGVVADTHVDAAIPAGIPRIVVHNKTDLAQLPARAEVREHATHVWISALHGNGVPELERAILAVADVDVAGEDTFIARERHVVALREAAQRARGALEHVVHPAAALELVAEELRECQAALASITGEFTADDLLGVIFSRFCIGK